MPPSKLSQKEKEKQKQRRDDINFLPPSFRHCLSGDWKLFGEEEQRILNVMFQDEFESLYYSQPYRDTTRLMARNIANKLRASNLDPNEQNIFRYLIQLALQYLAEYATEQLVKIATTSSGRRIAAITPGRRNLGVPCNKIFS